ncbi:MAG: hydrogenase maturation nickel metallochaperone HypA [Phycisphaerales bacterium]|nr:hydrogenase maturation nickel metallochaperone HypA [Phycisphaerae bacterium]NNF43401.1 hydrogenase maturation nickel metallochaperone HypA [Phycisphaerales bacterium]NNM25651.1 hydrogenase maturation nickel metallochaperone HypA [Phycisphaerales bacterium]
MHELPITQGILDLVVEHAGRAGAARVTDVHVVAGELSGVVDECIGFYWEIISRETIAAGACLHIRRVPLAFECRGCGARFAHEDGDFTCPTCGDASVRVASGDGVRVEAIDVEEVADAVTTGQNRAEET